MQPSAQQKDMLETQYNNQIGCFWVFVIIGLVYCVIPLTIVACNLTSPPYWIEIAIFSIGGISIVGAFTWRLLYQCWRFIQSKPGRLADEVLNA